MKPLWRALYLFGCLTTGGCGAPPHPPAWRGFDGNAARGAALIARSGCGGCHIVPGIRQASGRVGPPLTAFGKRTTVAGLLPNTPAGLVRWIRVPQQVKPGNAMPNLKLSESQARDIAAYLHSLR
jgi:cytochrome c1